MSHEALEQALKNLPQIGKLIKDRSYRQVWRFEFGGRPYYLKFYPASGMRNILRKRFRGSPALREFHRLQWLQKAGVPSPRAVAALIGFTISGERGDAVVLEGIEPSIQLDRHLNNLSLAGKHAPNHLDLSRQLASLLEKLGRANLGHSDLHLGNLVLKDDKLYLLDAYAVHRGGMKMKDIQLLALSAQPHATRADLLRIWRGIQPGDPLPPTNSRGPAIWRGLLNRAFHEDRYFGHLTVENWCGHFFRHSKFPYRWANVSRMDIDINDWQHAWPLLLQQLESDQFEILKRTRSGDVLAGEIVLAGRPIPVVVKRPRRKYWYRYINQIFRGTRPRRAWKRSWQLIVRNIPTAWPLIMMEKKTLGYSTDALIVFERIDGLPLSSPVWSARDEDEYHTLLTRAGRLLRQLERTGLYLYDAKAENWMVREDEILGLMPMLIDVDSVRLLNQGGGLKRLLRSLRESSPSPCTQGEGWGEDLRHRFSNADTLALLTGYAPFASPPELERLAGPEVDIIPPAEFSAAKRQTNG